MKFIIKTIKNPAIYFVAYLFLMEGCIKDECMETYTYKADVPVYMPYEEMRASVSSQNPQTLGITGKIYFKDNFIYVNELNKGIHVVDNTDPSSPQILSFIKIPGNVDMAIKDNTLYADSYIDMVAIDISDPKNISVNKRIPSVFPYQYQYKEYYFYNADTTKGVIIGSKEETITEKRKCNENKVCFEHDMNMVVTPNSTSNNVMYQVSDANNSTGIGGSMARFTIAYNYLYTVNNSNMQLFDISSSGNPVLSTNINVGWSIETIFPYKDKLFIGSQTGMYIYDNSNPVQPVKMSRYEHFTSCDPVVVDGNYAYVTLRSGNNCRNAANQLDVVDITDPYLPSLLKSYIMTNPHGLGVYNNTLFVCDGAAGLKVYAANDPNTIDNNLLHHFTGLSTYDVIPQQNLVMVIGPDGLYQYSYNEAYQLTLLSKIPVSGN